MLGKVRWRKSNCKGAEAGVRAEEGWCPAGPGWRGSGLWCPNGRQQGQESRGIRGTQDACGSMVAPLPSASPFPSCAEPAVVCVAGRTREGWYSARLSVYLKTLCYRNRSSRFYWPAWRDCTEAAPRHRPWGWRHGRKTRTVTGDKRDVYSIPARGLSG